MFTRRDLLVAGSAGVALGLLPRTRLLAQETSGGTSELLASFRLDALPGPADPGVQAWFFRVVGAPGAEAPLSLDIGPTAVYLESGSVTYLYTGTVRLLRKGSAAEDVLVSVGDTAAELMLSAGDAVITGSGNRTGAINTGETDAIGLQWGVASLIDEEAAMAEEVAEPALPWTSQLISVGFGALPAGAGKTMIERQSLLAGEHKTADRHDALESGGIEAGSITMTIVEGTLMHWPGVMLFDVAAAEAGGFAEEPQLVEIGPGQSAELAPDDGYSFAPGTIFDWNVGQEGVTIVRGTIRGITSASSAS